MRLWLMAVISTTLYTNAYWWTGDGFDYGKRYVADGIFVAASEQVDTTVDLEGQYVLPPLADAHNHNLQTPYLVENFAQGYVDQGVLYGAMLCGSPSSAAQTRELLAATALDIRLAGACVSSSDGHPLRMAMGGVGENAKQAPEAIYDKGYIVIDQPSDIAAKRRLFEQAGGDLSKLILVHHEDDARRNNETYFGLNGLTAEVFVNLVNELHKNGQTVVVHTESAADFALAVSAGVDWIGHLPGYHWHEGKTADDYRLSETVVQQAAAQGIAVIPTASVVNLFNGLNEQEVAQVQALQKENLHLLQHAGVTLLSGSDLFMGSVVDELLYLQQFDFTPAELLMMSTFTTPKALFPQRNIGRLDDGYEASFVSFERNPMNDLEHLSSPVYVVKQGRQLQTP